MASKVQSVLFKKDQWSVPEAIDWLIQNGFKHKKIDTTKTLYRFRQESPERFRRYFTKKLGHSGIMLVLGT